MGAEGTITVSIHRDIKAIHKELEKAIEKVEEEATIVINVCDCIENNEQTYNVKINYYLGGKYEGNFVNYIFSSSVKGDGKKEAIKRARVVLRMVKKWFENTKVIVEDGIKVYHA